MGSGYVNCACRDCFDVAIGSDADVPELCNDCEDAGCDPDGESECERSDAYGANECGYCSDEAIGLDDEGQPICGNAETCAAVHKEET